MTHSTSAFSAALSTALSTALPTAPAATAATAATTATTTTATTTAAATAAANAAPCNALSVAWAPSSPRIDIMFGDSFDASPRNALGCMPPALSLGTCESPPPPPPRCASPPSRTPPIKRAPILLDHTNHALPCALQPPLAAHERVDSRQRRLLRIQHRRRVRRNAPPAAMRGGRGGAGGGVSDAAALNRRAARVIRNREVALRARQRQKALMKRLETENVTLKSRALSLEQENGTLKTQIEVLRRGGGSFLDFDALCISVSGSGSN